LVVAGKIAKDLNQTARKTRSAAKVRMSRKLDGFFRALPSDEARRAFSISTPAPRGSKQD